MKIATNVRELRSLLDGRARPSFVPTMGNLHDGHMALVRLAASLADVTVCSIFVNRLQFGPADDFDIYPRTLDADLAALERNGCDIAFTPGERDLYPTTQTFVVHPDPELADLFEGAYRPGFFSGVSTVVLKLLCCVQPRLAVFGEKDHQQLLVVRRLVEQFCLDVEIVAAPLQRHADGLACSSRNAYLDERQRLEAPHLHSVLREVAERAEAGGDFAEIEREAMQTLRSRGWQPDYVAIRDAETLMAPIEGRECIVVAAARLGSTRLLDNVRLEMPRR